MKRPLTWKEQDMIEQVKATFAIEDMAVPKEAIQNAEAVLRGEKTTAQVIAELDEEYSEEK